jgi:hypothetical protein
MNLENYKAYARSEAEAQEIVRKMDSVNGKGSVSYRELPYSPGLFQITINLERVGA